MNWVTPCRTEFWHFRFVTRGNSSSTQLRITGRLIQVGVSCRAPQLRWDTKKVKETSWEAGQRKAQMCTRVSRVYPLTPIAVSEITHQFLECLTKIKVSDTQQMEILKNLESTFPINSHDVTVSPADFEDPMMVDEPPQEDPMEFRDVSQEESSRPVKRRNAVNLRTALLGQNPRESRRKMRDQLEPCFFLSYYGRKFRILHRLGSCMLQFTGVRLRKLPIHGYRITSSNRVRQNL